MQSPPTPPPFARRLLTLLLRDRIGRDVAFDLAEEFAEISARDGLKAARRWYARQVRRSIGARMVAIGAGMVSWCMEALAAMPRHLRVRTDCAVAFRSIRRAPWYSASIVAVVALAIALSTTVFATVDGVLFRPLPYADAGQLAGVELGFHRAGGRGGRVLPRDLDAWQALMPDVAISALEVAAVTGFERVNEAGLGIAHVRPNLLEVLGVRPFLGGFAEGDLELLRTGNPSPLPVLVSFEFWQTRLGADVSAIGRVVPPESSLYAPIRIAGVLPQGFAIPGHRAAHLLRTSQAHARSVRDTMVLARLPEGMSHQALAVRFEDALRVAAAVPDEQGGSRPDKVTVRPLRESLEARNGHFFRALFAGAITLVLIGCLNMSSLMTARCLGRARDIGLRRAIGARPGDIVRMLLVEHGLLCVAGAVIGLVIAGPVLKVTLTMLPVELHLLKSPEIDVRVVTFVMLATIVSLIAASLWPIHRALHATVQHAVTSGGGGAVTTRTASLVSRALTMGQVAGAVVLVVAGGLLVSSLLRVQSNEMGYDADRVVVAELGIEPWVKDPAIRRNWTAIGAQTGVHLDTFLDRIRALPGVQAAGALDVEVLVGSLSYVSRFNAVGVEQPAGHGPPGSLTVGDDAGGLKIPVTPGFFSAAGVRLIAGRLPTDAELRAGAPVAVVSRTFAHANFGSASAVGRFLEHVPLRKGLPHLEVVGVVEDPRLSRWDAKSTSTVFAPYALLGGAVDPVVFVRGDVGGRALVSDVLRLADAERPVIRPVRVQTASAMLGDSIRVRRLQSWLFGAFAASGLVLVGVGLFGFVAMTTARRTREVGIRIALGATRDRVVRGLVGEQVMPVLAGLVAGVGMAAWLAGLLEAYVYQMSIHDVRVWVVALLVVAGTTVAGAVIPSWQASRVDPLRALRID